MPTDHQLDPQMISIRELDLAGKRVMVRADLNVPLRDKIVQSEERIRASLATIRYALSHDAAVLVISHLGRPEEGQYDDAFSLAPVARRLFELLAIEGKFLSEWIDGYSIESGQLAVGENVRFLAGELGNDPDLCRRMAEHCDIFVMDAFGTAHRAQASTEGVIHHAPLACCGILLEREIVSLDAALDNPAAPVVAIVGGAKIQDKLPILHQLSNLADTLIVGGGIANTFLAASGCNVGRSLYEPEFIDEAENILNRASANGCKIPLPVDVVVAPSLENAELATQKNVAKVGSNDMIFDVGRATIERYSKLIHEAGTIIWNGPVGVFEHPSFTEGTKTLAESVAESNAYSVAGGGDTLTALNQFDVIDRVSYATTGGGAFLEYVRAGSLPAIDALQRASQQNIEHNVKVAP